MRGASAQLIGTDQIANTVGAVRDRATTAVGNVRDRATTAVGNVRDRAGNLCRQRELAASSGSASGSANGSASGFGRHRPTKLLSTVPSRRARPYPPWGGPVLLGTVDAGTRPDERRPSRKACS